MPLTPTHGQRLFLQRSLGASWEWPLLAVLFQSAAPALITHRPPCLQTREAHGKRTSPFRLREPLAQRSYFACPSSLLRASSARRCSSSCNFFCCASKTCGSVGGPS